MSSAMKAIETRYRGHRFRSRLEARWAVFFDAAGVTWEYEPQGFEFSLIRVPTLEETDEGLGFEPYESDEKARYLPDFWLPSLQTWFEVKPARPLDTDADYVKWWSFSRHLKDARAVLAYGQHPDPERLSVGGHPEGAVDHYGRVIGVPFDMILAGDYHYAWCVCPWCGKAGIEYDARGARVCGYDAHYNDEHAALAAIRHLGHHRADDKCYTGNDRVIKAAYAAARAARFEFGESG